MSNNFSRNSYKVNDIYERFDNETWKVDSNYQRRKVWGIKDNIRLIETILLDLVVPEIFLWDCDTNPDTGKTVTHIVDGQQRIRAIFDFISDKYKLQSKYLLDKNIKDSYGDKAFSELDDDTKRKIWTYEISVVNLRNTFSIEEIKNIFYRLNLTDYSLNDQEKRNSLDSAFGKVAETLSDNSFWSEYKVFSPKDIRRMGDVEYCSSIILLCKQGVVDQTKQDVLDHIYEDYADEYLEEKEDLDKINTAMTIINELATDEVKTFMSKKIQMYTLFSFAFDCIDNSLDLTRDIKERFTQFVKTYNSFKNEYDFEFENDMEKKAYELIKKYKLASSEGVNKLTNRMIRFEVMKKILLGIETISIEDLKTVENKCIEKENEDN